MFVGVANERPEATLAPYAVRDPLLRIAHRRIPRDRYWLLYEMSLCSNRSRNLTSVTASARHRSILLSRLLAYSWNILRMESGGTTTLVERTAFVGVSDGSWMYR